MLVRTKNLRKGQDAKKISNLHTLSHMLSLPTCEGVRKEFLHLPRILKSLRCCSHELDTGHARKLFLTVVVVAAAAAVNQSRVCVCACVRMCCDGAGVDVCGSYVRRHFGMRARERRHCHVGPAAPLHREK